MISFLMWAVAGCEFAGIEVETDEGAELFFVCLLDCTEGHVEIHMAGFSRRATGRMIVDPSCFVPFQSLNTIESGSNFHLFFSSGVVLIKPRICLIICLCIS